MFTSKLYWNNRPKRKQLDDNSIKVTIPDTSSLWYVSDNLGVISETAPNLFRKAQGDFEVKVKISGIKRMDSMHDQAGIVIRESKTVYFRFGIEMRGVRDLYRRKEIEPCVRPVIIRNEVIDSSSEIPLTDEERENDEYWFSVRHRNGVLTAFCSNDGINYKAVRKIRLSKEDRLSVGLYGANPIGPNGFKVVYEDFYIIENPSGCGRRMASSSHSAIKSIHQKNFEKWKKRRDNI